MPGGKPVPITRSPAPSRSSISRLAALLVTIFVGALAMVVSLPMQSATLTG